MENGQEWNVGQLLSTSSVYWRSSTVHAAVKLEIFSVIGDRQLTVAEVSDGVGGKPRGVSMLLNGLTAMGLLKHENNRYGNTDFSRSCLVKEEPGYIGYIIMHHFHLVDAWAQLHEAVLHGEPVESRSHGDELERESFQLGMFNLAKSYKERGMAAYSEFQQEEFTHEKEAGYMATTHQRFVGTGYFDRVMETVSGGKTAVSALAGSTEEEQFEEEAVSA